MENSIKSIPVYCTADESKQPIDIFSFRSKALNVPAPLLKVKDTKPGDWLRSAIAFLQGKEQEVASELFYYLVDKNLCIKTADKEALRAMTTQGASGSFKHLLTSEVPTVPTSAVGAIVFQMAQFENSEDEVYQIIGGLLEVVRNLKPAVINRQHWEKQKQTDGYALLQNSLAQ